MFSWFDKIRKESPHKKRFIAFSISALFTGIIFVVWFSVWLPNINKKEEIALRKPQDILKEIKDLDEESAAILESILKLI